MTKQKYTLDNQCWLSIMHENDDNCDDKADRTKVHHKCLQPWVCLTFFGSQHLQAFNLFDMRSKRWWWTQYTIHVQYNDMTILVFCHHSQINFPQGNFFIFQIVVNITAARYVLKCSFEDDNNFNNDHDHWSKSVFEQKLFLSMCFFAIIAEK